MRTILIASVLALGTAGAQAQDDGRYTLRQTDEGYVRMDNRTGEMSICFALAMTVSSAKIGAPTRNANAMASLGRASMATLG